MQNARLAKILSTAKLPLIVAHKKGEIRATNLRRFRDTEAKVRLVTNDMKAPMSILSGSPLKQDLRATVVISASDIAKLVPFAYSKKTNIVYRTTPEIARAFSRIENARVHCAVSSAVMSVNINKTVLAAAMETDVSLKHNTKFPGEMGEDDNPVTTMDTSELDSDDLDALNGDAMDDNRVPLDEDERVEDDYEAPDGGYRQVEKDDMDNHGLPKVAASVKKNRIAAKKRRVKAAEMKGLDDNTTPSRGGGYDYEGGDDNETKMSDDDDMDMDDDMSDDDDMDMDDDMSDEKDMDDDNGDEDASEADSESGVDDQESRDMLADGDTTMNDGDMRARDGDNDETMMSDDDDMNMSENEDDEKDMDDDGEEDVSEDDSELMNDDGAPNNVQSPNNMRRAPDGNTEMASVYRANLLEELSALKNKRVDIVEAGGDKSVYYLFYNHNPVAVMNPIHASDMVKQLAAFPVKFKHAFFAATRDKGITASVAKDFGLKPLVIKLTAATLINKAIAKKVKEIKANYHRRGNNIRKRLQHSINIAAVGINKNFWKATTNPLRENLCQELAANNVRNPERIIDKVFEHHGEEYLRTIMTRASIIAKKPPSFREELAHTVEDANYQPIKRSEGDVLVERLVHGNQIVSDDEDFSVESSDNSDYDYRNPNVDEVTALRNQLKLGGRR